MNTLLDKYNLSQANKLYKDSKHNLTQKELILKSYSRSAEFLSEAISNHRKGKILAFIEETNKSIIIIQNMLFNLQYYDKNGNRLIVADNLHSTYNFILDTLRKGINNKNTANFDICISHLHELYDAFDKAN